MTETHDQGTSHATFSTHTHSYLCQHIQLADQKAAFVLAFNSALIASIYASCLKSDHLEKVDDWARFVALAAFIVAGLSICLCFWIVRPRTNTTELPLEDKGPIFWEGILQGSRPQQDYTNYVSKLSESELSQALHDHNHDLAKVCAKKYGWLQWSVTAAGFGVVLGICYFANFFWKNIISA